MKRENWYLSTIDPQAEDLAIRYGLGLEIAEFCTAYYMDACFGEMDKAVRQRLAGIQRRTFHAPFNELFPCAIDPKARELARMRYRQAIALAQGYGAGKVVIHGGYNPMIYYPCWYREQSVDFWRDFVQELPKNMEICLENVLEEEPEMLLDILKAVNHPRLRLCLDVGHVNAYSHIPAEDWLRTCAPWITHFHIHNNDGTRDAHSDVMVGTIPMEELLSLADSLCLEATYTLELPDGSPSVRWLERFWGNAI